MTEPQENNRDKSSEPPIPAAAAPRTRVAAWLVPAGVVFVFAVGGFVIGRSFGTRGHAQTAAGAEAGHTPEASHAKEPGAGESWYYDLDPVVVNLNDPGVTRYVRISLTLQLRMDEKEGRPMLDQKKPLLKHWLTLFLSNQTIEDTRGEKNLMRMQAQICDTLNTNLFPDSKPQITNILFKEFAIQ